MNAKVLAALLGGAGLVMAFAPNAGASAVGSSGAAAPSVATAPCGTTTTPPASVKHVIWIFMENNSYNTIKGNSNAPYINSLISSCGSADNYHNITHNSLPNYLGATDGARLSALLKYDSDCTPSPTCEVKSNNLFHQTVGHGGWKGFDESMPSNCYQANDGFYTPRHNPAVYDTDLAGCSTDDVPLGTTTSSPLLTDLNSQKKMPAFAFVTPNLCDDMHGESGCPSNLIMTGDTWLSQWVPLITGSPDYQSGNTVLFITWDEGSGGTRGENCTAMNTTDESCTVLFLAVAPSVVPGTLDEAQSNHYALLKTTEDLLGLPELGLAASATSLAPAFNL